MNISDTAQFHEYMKEQQQKLISNESQWNPNKSKTFPNGWIVEMDIQDKIIRCRLYDAKKELKHEWINLDPQVPQVEIISHSNGADYLIYHIGLYGISVFNLYTLTKYDYYPEKSFPMNKEDFQESFIWANTFYSPNSNLIVFFGCYWAAPYTGMITDFSDPMNITDESWCDLQDLLDPTRDDYMVDDVIGWSENSLEILVEDQKDMSKKKVSYTVEQLKDFINKAKNE